MSDNNDIINANEEKNEEKLEEKVEEKKEEKNEELLKSRNKKLCESYSSCFQKNFSIISVNRAFQQPFSIEQSTLYYSSLITSSESKKSKKPLVVVNNTSIFIGGKQNLKGMRVYLSGSNKYNNTVHREITNFKNKNKSVDKTNHRLIENRLAEKVNIDLSENNTKDNINNKDNEDNKNNKDNSLDPLQIINLRWKKNQNVNKTSLSYINKTDSVILNKKKYIQELVNKININSTQTKDNNKSLQESYILIKQDKYNKNKSFIHEIISPNSYEELETSVNSFIDKNDYNKENQDNNSNGTIIQENQDNYLNNGKKKSKFSAKQQVSHIKKKKDNNTNSSKLKEDFIPVFILSKKDIKELYEIIEKKSGNKPKKISSYSIDNKIFVNIIRHNNYEKLRGGNDKTNKNMKALDDINFDIYPVKVEKFELINSPNGVKDNYNIDVSNIALNQSDYMKQVKAGENEFDALMNKNKDKEMMDFSQNTPISLLQEKYFIYAVSKWIKYSIPHPQSQMYVKYSYKTGHPMFDPINLIMTNFTLWIERIETKWNDNKKALISISSSVNYNNLKNKNGRGKSLNNTNKKKKGYTNIYSNQTNNYNDNKKRNNSKAKNYK